MEKGFTIIELIISIFILSIAIVGVFTSFSMIVVLTSDTSNRLTATYLAQEGMEITRNIRDTNWLNMHKGGSGTWVDGLTTVSSCINANLGCEADYESTSMSGNSGEYLYLNNSTGFYGYNQSNATETKFQRKIIVTPISADGGDANILMVKVEVSWDQKATILNPYCAASDYGSHGCANGITTEGTLYNWYTP